ncbi:hypothetical protein VAE308_970010 [Vibrio aestuarianus]|uniref:Uncharacterized protein n=1 Tax=Vibrio aestuarianus TaxID=28171 RepID=A0ABM9FM70_9VIBR|nr:hypothetical protein VAE063_880011 [Vibrio aestuarianus]CAH8235571.1 hypothetical protein VAE308_970010 [Vibrio aestuarianus]
MSVSSQLFRAVKKMEFRLDKITGRKNDFILSGLTSRYLTIATLV